MRRILLVLAALAVSPLAAANPTSIATANLTLGSGGTAQALVTAGKCVGTLYISNGDTATNQGGIMTAEPIFFSLVDTAAAGGGNGSLELVTGVLAVPTFGAAVSWVAATTGHKISAFCE